MTPEAAWQSTIDLLRTQIPKATFDTWVQQTRLLRVEDSLGEGLGKGLGGGKRFVIDAGGEYARAWLSQHLTSIIENTLSGCLGATAQVHFCVDGDGISEAGEEISSQGASVSLESETPGQAERKEMILYEARLSLRDLFVKHEREIAIPGYFRRWIPYLGPTLAWMVVAFRQAFYLKAGCQARDGGEFTARAEQIIRWSGLGRSTFWEAMKDPRLGWFVQQVNEGARWMPDERTGQPRQKPNRYRFTVAMPLTPGDAAALAAWLEAAGIRRDPTAALHLAIECERNEILPEPAPPPEPAHALPAFGAPRSVHEVVHRLCGRLPRQAFAEVNALADELEAHLVPKNDLIFITWYFLQNWVAELGVGPAWLVTLLRDRCYFSRNGGQNRNTVRVYGGASALATMLGLSRPKTVDEWLPPLQMRSSGGGDGIRQRRKAAQREKVALFLSRCNGNGPHAESGARNHWQFQVTDYGAEPLLPDDEQAYQALLEIVGAYLESGERDELEAFYEDLSRARTGLSHGQSGRVSDSHSEETGRDPDSDTDNYGANRTLGRARSGLVLKHLIKSLIEIETLDAAITRLETLVESPNGKIFSDETVVMDGKWNVKRLLERSQIGAKRKIIEAGVTPQAFISRLLYLYSPLGAGLKDGRGWLVNSLLEGPQAGAGGGYDELARLAPVDLGRLVQDALKGWEGQVRPSANMDWDGVMRGSSRERLEKLAVGLGIDVKSLCA